MTADPKSLRALAEKATQGVWSAIGEICNVDGGGDLWCGEVLPPTDAYRGRICAIQSCDHIGGIPQEEAAANAAYIAAAHPQAIIGLLDRIERLEAIECAARTYFVRYLQDEAAERICCINDQQHADAGALRATLEGK